MHVANFLSLLPVIWPWLILVAAQMAVLAGQSGLGLMLLAVFGATALTIGLLSPMAIVITCAVLFGASRLPELKGRAAGVGHLALIMMCVALGAHLLPGFHNPQILEQAHAGPGSTAFTMFLNVDKPMVFFAVVLAWPAMRNSGQSINMPSLALGLGTLPFLFVIAVFAGAVKPEIGLPPWWLIFAFSNLFLTCLAEEAFFRGYLQSALSSRLGAAGGLALASILFGLAHIAGGPALVVFAALLGLACGLGYFGTGRLWVPVAMHFGFNFAHLAFFTYPGPV